MSRSTTKDDESISEAELSFLSSGATKQELLQHVAHVGGIDPFNDTLVTVHSYFAPIPDFFQDCLAIFRASTDSIRDISYLNLLKKWLKNNAHLLADQGTAQAVRHLIDEMALLPNVKKFTTHLSSTLDRLTLKTSSSSSSNNSSSSSSNNSDNETWFERQFLQPLPAPEGFGSESLMTLHAPELIAQQLTLIDHQFLRRLTPSDFLHRAHTKPAASPNLQLFIRRFNDTAFWAVTELLKTIQPKARTAMLCRFVELASLLRQHKNFSACLAVLSALRCTPVARLKQTWKGLPRDLRAQFDDLSGLASPADNYAHYRRSLAASQPPMIPYLGCMTKDFTALDDLPLLLGGGGGGPPGVVSGERDRVNWRKLREMGMILNLLRSAQDTVFLFPVSEQLTQSLALITRSNMSEDKQYKISHALEPPAVSQGSPLAPLGHSASMSALPSLVSTSADALPGVGALQSSSGSNLGFMTGSSGGNALNSSSAASLSSSNSSPSNSSSSSVSNASTLSNSSTSSSSSSTSTSSSSSSTSSSTSSSNTPHLSSSLSSSSSSSTTSSSSSSFNPNQGDFLLTDQPIIIHQGDCFSPDALLSELQGQCVTSGCGQCAAQEERYRAAQGDVKRNLRELTALGETELLSEQLYHCLSEGSAQTAPISLPKDSVIRSMQQKKEIRGRIAEQEEELGAGREAHEGARALAEQTEKHAATLFDVLKGCQARSAALGEAEGPERARQATAVLEMKLNQAATLVDLVLQSYKHIE